MAFRRLPRRAILGGLAGAVLARRARTQGADVAARRALVEAATRLDAAGRRLWARLIGLERKMMVTPWVHADA